MDAGLAANVKMNVDSHTLLISSMTDLLANNLRNAVPLAMEVVLRSTRLLTALRRALKAASPEALAAAPELYQAVLKIVQLAAYLPWVLNKMFVAAKPGSSVHVELLALRKSRRVEPHSQLASDLNNTIRCLEVRFDDLNLKALLLF